ncbi:hypothetical protein ACJIZ3_004819 [Penstemon smallii]|uniref:Uncharacterized protein n=1 Tax=Penstemon smallii TaxID=265156 RepID=A0ABD3S360_9LAMI
MGLVYGRGFGVVLAWSFYNPINLFWIIFGVGWIQEGFVGEPVEADLLGHMLLRPKTTFNRLQPDFLLSGEMSPIFRAEISPVLLQLKNKKKVEMLNTMMDRDFIGVFLVSLSFCLSNGDERDNDNGMNNFVKTVSLAHRTSD